MGVRGREKDPAGEGEGSCVPTVNQPVRCVLGTTNDTPCDWQGLGGVQGPGCASSAGLLPVLGDSWVGLCRAVERDNVVLQHWLWFHRQVDKWGVCREKRFLCKQGDRCPWFGDKKNPWVTGRVKARDSISRDP